MSFFKSSFHKYAGGAALLLTSTLLSAPSMAEPEPETVNRHIVFMTDVSSSVNEKEYPIMMGALAESLRSPETKKQLETGLVYAFSTVFFNGIAVHGDTHIVRSPQDAEKFAAEAIERKIKDRPLKHDWGTGIIRGYNAVEELFRREPEMNFAAQSRSVLVIGDGIDNITEDAANVYAGTMHLGRVYGAAVFGIPIIVEAPPGKMTKEQFVDYFAANVATSKGAFFDDPDGRKIPIPMGGVFAATGFEKVNEAVSQAILMNPF